MNVNDLSRLEKVELRDVWKSEAGDFTPWLAIEENIALLSATIGIELEVEAQEKNVGPFRADILCKNTLSDNWVLIENQLEKTDHTHLGQLLTYASGLDAVTIVWIAYKFTEEHRAALDWLNEITNERFNFFGLEVELWRIGNSPIAPKFNIVSNPNDWTKRIAKAASQIGNVELTETRKLQLEFWTRFSEALQNTKEITSTQSPRPQYWFNVALGRSGIHLSLIANTYDKRIGVRLYMSGNVADTALDQLLEHKEEIEKEIGSTLIWNPFPDKKDKIILLDINADITKTEKWNEYINWLVEYTLKFRHAFSSRIKELDL